MIVRRPTDIAAAIKRARKAEALTQEDLATKVEVGRQWVYRLENGEAGVSLGLVLRALNVLGLRLRIESAKDDLSTDPANPDKPARPRISIDDIVDE